MTWLKQTLAILAQKVEPKHAFCILMTAIICVTAYYILDRILDYQASSVPQRKKRVVVVDESIKDSLTVKAIRGN